MPNPEVNQMTSEQVVEWIVSKNSAMKQYRDVFIENQITGEVLTLVDENFLQNDLGITGKVHRYQIMKLIASLAGSSDGDQAEPEQTDQTNADTNPQTGSADSTVSGKSSKSDSKKSKSSSGTESETTTGRFVSAYEIVLAQQEQRDDSGSASDALEDDPYFGSVPPDSKKTEQAESETSDSHLILLPFNVLQAASGGWSDTFELGHGAYSTVYRASLPSSLVNKTKLGHGILDTSDIDPNDGHVDVACKLLKSDSDLRQKAEAKLRREKNRRGGRREKLNDGIISAKVKRELELQDEHLIAELKVMSKYRHRNLCMLLGFAAQDKAGMEDHMTPQRCLVYELCPNGCLLTRLSRDAEVEPHLTPQQRLDLAAGIGKGLEYLHRAGVPPVVHRDVKSANIMIDKHMQAKVADFGSVRQESILQDASHVSTSNPFGTPVYMAPEYLKKGHISHKVDAYAMGVVLLELLTGLNPGKVKLKALVKDALGTHLSGYVAWPRNGQLSASKKREGTQRLSVVEESVDMSRWGSRAKSAGNYREMHLQKQAQEAEGTGANGANGANAANADDVGAGLETEEDAYYLPDATIDTLLDGYAGTAEEDDRFELGLDPRGGAWPITAARALACIALRLLERDVHRRAAVSEVLPELVALSKHSDRLAEQLSSSAAGLYNTNSGMQLSDSNGTVGSILDGASNLTSPGSTTGRDIQLLSQLQLQSLDKHAQPDVPEAWQQMTEQQKDLLGEIIMDCDMAERFEQEGVPMKVLLQLQRQLKIGPQKALEVSAYWLEVAGILKPAEKELLGLHNEHKGHSVLGGGNYMPSGLRPLRALQPMNRGSTIAEEGSLNSWASSKGSWAGSLGGSSRGSRGAPPAAGGGGYSRGDPKLSILYSNIVAGGGRQQTMERAQSSKLQYMEIGDNTATAYHKMNDGDGSGSDGCCCTVQ